MCERLGELRGAVCAYVAGFDADLLSGADAVAVMSEAAAIEAAAATLRAMAAARVAHSGAWAGSGDASAARFVARASGTTVSAASEAIATAQRLKDLPHADAAARRGELSAPQAAAVVAGASADPGAERRLVEMVKGSSLQELRTEAARVRAAAEGDDAEARRRRIHAKRSLRQWTDLEGAWHLHVTNTADVGARIMAVLRAVADELFRRARAEGRREPPEAYGADALDEVVGAYGAAGDGGGATGAHADAGAPGAADSGAADSGAAAEPAPGAGATSTLPGIVEGPADPGTPVPGEPAGAAPTAPAPRRSRVLYKVITRVDFGALLRGRVVEGEVCEIAGFGPVPVSVVREMLASGNAILAAVITNGVRVAGVAHMSRRANAWQQTALEWAYPTCAAEGCSATARLENDHRDDWVKTLRTSFDGLDRLCPRDHDLKTREGWALVDGVGKRPFVPPSDPRHPRNAGRAGAQRPPPAAANDPPEAA